MPVKRSKAAVIRRKQKQIDVKQAREWFQQMIQEVGEEYRPWVQEEHLAVLNALETRVREWRP